MQSTRREFLRKIGVGAAALSVPTVVWTPAHAAGPKFTLYLTVFNNVQVRMIWTELIGRNIAALGIEVVTSFVPISEILARRSNEDGATYLDGGFDMYSERILYTSLSPQPEVLFSRGAMPPLGNNYYRVNDDILEEAMQTFSRSPDPAVRAEAIKTFQRRWYDIEPLNIVYYPEDVIATNPALSGFAETTYNPFFFPRAENWTLEGVSGDQVTAAFASWPMPTSLVPMFAVGYHESNIFGPVYNSLMDYDSWEGKNLRPALAESVTSSEDGKTWTIRLREGVKWHSGEPFTAEDVKFTWDTILDPAVGSVQNARLLQVFGGAEAYRIVSPLEIEVTLPEFNINFEASVLPSISIMPKHAYESIGAEAWRSHVISNWTGSFTVTKSDGSSYEAKGAIGTGPWIADGFDAARSAYRMQRNPDYWREAEGNVTEFLVVNIQGTDAVLAALRAGEIDAHDPMYEIGTLVGTIDPSWGTIHRFDSYKWQQTCLNNAHPVYGTGVETPLGRAEPARAAEAATYVRKAFSHAIPREEIIRNLIGGYGVSGTVPMPYTAAEYDHEYLQPIAFDMDLARDYLRRAGYED